MSAELTPIHGTPALVVVAEWNRGRHLRFVPTLDELADRLQG